MKCSDCKKAITNDYVEAKGDYHVTCWNQLGLNKRTGRLKRAAALRSHTTKQ